MKKLLCLFWLLLLAGALLCACNEEPDADTHTHTLTAVEAIAATCESEGCDAYWKCECGKLFSDANGVLELGSLAEITRTKHSATLKTVAAKSPTCTSEGNIAYYHCTACEGYFSDGAASEEITDKSSVTLSVTDHRTAWRRDAEHHWKVAVCGCAVADTPKQAHTLNAQQICTACDANFDTLHLTFALNSTSTGYGVQSTDLTSGVIVVPAIYNNKPVTNIYAEAFAGLTGITDVILPDSIERIAEEAFEGCAALTQKDGIYYAGNWAVGVDPTITDAVLRAGTRGIANKAFARAHKLERVYIPASVQYINFNAFEDCPALTSVTVESIVAWCGVKFGNASANPLSTAHDLYVGGRLVTDLVIPEGVEAIGDFAFFGCTSITRLTLPESLTYLGGQCFKDCTELVEIGYNATDAGGEEYGYFFANAGRDGDGITVRIGAGVQAIPEVLFYGPRDAAPKVVAVIFAEGSVCTSIGQMAFYGCTSLASASMPSGCATGWTVGYIDIDPEEVADPATLARLLCEKTSSFVREVE